FACGHKVHSWRGPLHAGTPSSVLEYTAPCATTGSQPQGAKARSPGAKTNVARLRGIRCLSSCLCELSHMCIPAVNKIFSSLAQGVYLRGDTIRHCRPPYDVARLRF